MLAKILILFILLFSSFSQSMANETNADPVLFKKIGFGLGFETGTLVNNTDGLLDRNEFTFGVYYTQNFSTLPWFSLSFGLGAINSTTYSNVNNGTAINPNYTLEGVNNVNFALDYAQIILNFSQYLSITVRHQFLTYIYAYYPIRIRENQLFVLYGGIELFPYKRFDTNTDTPNEFDTTLDYVEFGFTYSIGLPKNLVYSTRLAFVTRGRAFSVGDTLIYEANTADAYLHNFEIEWDNTLTYNDPSGLTWSGTLRYLGSRFSSLNVPTVDNHVNHDVVLVMGLGYAFDIEEYKRNRQS